MQETFFWEQKFAYTAVLHQRTKSYSKEFAYKSGLECSNVRLDKTEDIYSKFGLSLVSKESVE